MLTGFEEQTKPLTEREETEYLPPILQGLRVRIGKDKAITNKEMKRGLMVNRGIEISEARVRKIINHIRCHNLIPYLIATSDGYYVAETEQELIDYEESLAGREEAIREVRLSIRQQRIMKYHMNKQLSLFET